MGFLRDVIKQESGGDVTDNSYLVHYFKDNVSYMYNLYTKPDGKLVDPIIISKIVNGYFYFLTYRDESNWMQYSPIFFCDWKKFDNKIIGYGVNFNFIPIEIRVAIFDTYIKNFEDPNIFSSITFEKMYKMLLKYGYEYALVEYDLARIVSIFKIDITILPNFLCSTYPSIKYDPINLYNIWKKKLETREMRHQEIIQMYSDDFLSEYIGDITEKYDQLSNHIKRLKRNNDKYG